MCSPDLRAHVLCSSEQWKQSLILIQNSQPANVQPICQTLILQKLEAHNGGTLSSMFWGVLHSKRENYLLSSVKYVNVWLILWTVEFFSLTEMDVHKNKQIKTPVHE